MEPLRAAQPLARASRSTVGTVDRGFALLASSSGPRLTPDRALRRLRAFGLALRRRSFRFRASHTSESVKRFIAPRARVASWSAGSNRQALFLAAAGFPRGYTRATTHWETSSISPSATAR